MINIEIIQEIHTLSSLFEKRWGMEIDYTGMPIGITQERLLLILRYIVNTGDSVLVGAQKIRDITRAYLDYLVKQHTPYNKNIENGYVFDMPCPLCGNKVRYCEVGNSYSYICDTRNCYNVACRGI